MTEPKEEKCEACCGSGYINFWTDDGHISMRTCRRCDGYGYIKVKQMTNEEWFDTLSTEQKAETIAQLSSYGGNVDAILKWLKQPHQSVSNCNE